MKAGQLGGWCAASLALFFPVLELWAYVIYGPRFKAAPWKGLFWEGRSRLKKENHHLLGKISGRTKSRLYAAFRSPSDEAGSDLSILRAGSSSSRHCGKPGNQGWIESITPHEVKR